MGIGGARWWSRLPALATLVSVAFLGALAVPLSGCVNRAVSEPFGLTVMATGDVRGYIDPCG